MFKFSIIIHLEKASSQVMRKQDQVLSKIMASLRDSLLIAIVRVKKDNNVCRTFPGGVLPYIRYIGMCRPKGYGF